MATKIDLLPRYVPMRRRFKRWSYAMGALSLATLLFILAVDNRQKAKLGITTTNADTVKARADITDSVESSTATIVGQTAASADAVKFFTDAAKTGGQRAQLIDEVRRYVLGSMKVDSMDLSTANATMQAGIPSKNAYVEAIRVLRQAELDNVFVVNTTKFSGISTFNQRPPAEFVSGIASPGSVLVYPDRVNIATTLVHPSTEPSPPGGAVGTAPAGGLSGSSSTLASPSSSRSSTGNSGTP